MTTTPTIAEMEARVAEFMGVDKPLTRDLAMVKVGWKYVRSTGYIFDLANGESIPMPPWEELPKPDGSDNTNDRYAFRVAVHLGDKIAAEVDAYRLPAPKYGEDLNLWPAVYTELANRELMPAYVGLLLETWRGDSGGHVTFERFLLMTAAEDRLRALCAVLDEMEKR